jgi:gluconate 5-dehydrogenase
VVDFINKKRTEMKDELFSVDGQVVLAAGASRGIGRALAEGFAQRGAQVVIAGREADTLEKTAREISSDAKAVKAIVCDVSRPEDVNRLVEETLSSFGRIMKVEDYPPDVYDWIIDINLRGSFMLAQAVGRHMISRKSGCIVNVDSLNTYAPLTGVAPYAMSKAGVLMMTRAMAHEWGRHGIRVNSIAPGFFPTALSEKLWAEKGMRDWAETHTPLGKLGDVRELVGTAIFLASPAAAFITGQTVRVDGGITAGITWPIPL